MDTCLCTCFFLPIHSSICINLYIMRPFTCSSLCTLIRLHVASCISLTVYPFVIHSSLYPTVHTFLHFISTSIPPSSFYYLPLARRFNSLHSSLHPSRFSPSIHPSLNHLLGNVHPTLHLALHTPFYATVCPFLR